MSEIDPLIAHGLRFGDLLMVHEQHLVDRYNAALQAFGLQAVAKAPLFIDLCGFSLEVALELGDMDYLNPAEVNPRFIIVSVDQAKAPLVHSSFSSTKKLFQAFFQHNYKALEVIMFRDAVYGEIENSLMRARVLEDIISFPHVTFECHTVNNVIERTRELRLMVEDFKTNEDKWTDLSAMQEIVGLAEICGDIRNKNPEITMIEFKHPKSFSTSLYGGATIIDGVVIGRAEELKKASNGSSRIIDIDNIEELVTYLTEKELIENVDVEWLITSDFLNHRIEMIAADILADTEQSLEPFVDGVYPEVVMQNNHRILEKNEVFRDLDHLRSIAVNGGIDAAEEFVETLPLSTQLMLVRATPQKAATNDVNRILINHCKADYLTLFVLDKPAFYDKFKTLNSKRQEFAVKLIEARYMSKGHKSARQKHALKQRFFGNLNS